MHKACLSFTIVFICTACQAQQGNSAKMFRNNASHNSPVVTSNDFIYDTKAWSFFAGAPVRSSALVGGNLVFFGNTLGNYFAINKMTGKLIWQYNTGFPINSSAASQDGKIFFSDNKQTVYSLNEATGKFIWKFDMAAKQAYPWRFDYYYSSPTLYENKLIIGGDDGYLYMLNQNDGKQVWKFKSKGIVRGTAAVFDNTVVVGDMDGALYALDIKNGNQKWNFKTVGDSLKNENFGFDRKAILSSPVISQNKILFGCRDGLLYCVDVNGTLLWKMDHRVSWVISTVAVKDSIVVTGTSDGHFVQAVSLNTGKQIWRTSTNTLHWSSPLIVNNRIYIGGFDGNEYCFDLSTGKVISKFQTGGIVLSSAIFDSDHLYVGSDDGCLYSLSGHKDKRVNPDKLKRYVFYEPGINIYFRNNSDLKIKNYLVNSGYKVINTDSLTGLLSGIVDQSTIIVFASDYFPKSITQNAGNSLLRKFLDAGGRVVLTGINPLVYIIDEEGKQPVGFNVPAADSVLGIKYGENDTRSFGGQFSCFATEKGKQLGLPDFWTSILQLNPEQVDVVLGKNENGFISAFAKNYKNGGKFIQVWMNQEAPDHLDAILKLSEWKID
jgi:outer membrane protein assembly factor BamB